MTPALRTVLLEGYWSPLQLQFSGQLVAWWDVNVGVVAPGGSVNSWADKVGGATLAQGTGTAKPVFGTSTLSSTPGVTFDGSDDFLALTGVPTAWPIGSASGWIFSLAQQQALVSDTNPRVLFGYGGSTAGTARNQARTASNLAQVGDRSTGANSAAEFDSYGALTGQYAAASLSGAFNGVSITPAATTLNTATTRIRMGSDVGTTAASFFQGVVGQVLVGNGTLSTGDRQRLEGWSLWQIGQPQKLPTTHPYRYRRP